MLLNGEGRCIDANAAACELFRSTKQDILAAKLQSFADLMDQLPAQMQRAAAHGSSDGVTRVLNRTDEVTIEYSIKPASTAGLFLFVAKDRTAQSALERQLQQCQKLDTLGRLAGGVAHDFNNMLTVIRGYAELLAARLEAQHPLRRYALRILNAAERSASITRQLLTFSRPQSTETKVIDLNVAIQEIEGLLRRLIGEGIELSMSLAPDLGRVRADTAQICQVLLNLAVNAKDAMNDRGRLLIKTSNAQLGEGYGTRHLEAVPGDYAMLSVSDNGCGMDEQIRSRMFEPFFSTKDQDKGTGLGLATVRDIVKQWGGYIWVYSEEGEGTTFKIYLPRLDGKKEDERDRDRCPPQASGQVVLVIENDDDTRDIVRECLQQNGYVVLATQGGDEALTLCESHKGRIDLVLSDVVMPGTNGQDLSGYLVCRHPQLKMLYMSGFPLEELASRGLNINPETLIEKPFRLGELLTRIAGTLGTPAMQQPT